MLKEKFLDSEFGRTVTCGVQLLDEEEHGQKLIDDGLSTVCALVDIKTEHWTHNQQTKPDGGAWDPQLVEIFTNGLAVQVVQFEDDTDRDAREAWNIAKHDKSSVSVACSTVWSQINMARMRYAKQQN